MSKTIHNIAELAAEYGTTPEHLERAVYKSTECGAWIEWDDKEVRIGSIVEGSEAEVYPATLSFPFTMQEYEEAVQEIEADADALWREANLTWEEQEKFFTSANPWDAPGMKVSDFL